jgi:hypothetical protein
MYCLLTEIFSLIVSIIIIIVLYLAYKIGINSIYEKMIRNICIFNLFYSLISFIQGIGGHSIDIIIFYLIFPIFFLS